MSRSNVTVYECDRCGEKEECRRPEQEYRWAGVNFSEVNGHRWIGSQRSAKPQWADLCPGCSAELYSWFLAGKPKVTPA